MNYTKLIILVSLLLSYLSAQGQTEVIVRDFETWSNIGVNKEFDNNFKINFEQGLRLYNNTSSVDQYFSNLELIGKFNKSFSIAGGLRYLRKIDKDNGEFENFIRFHADLNYKHS